jgi:hypothetical protein
MPIWYDVHEITVPHCLQTKRRPIVDQGQFCGRESSQTSTMRRSQLPPDHAMLRVTWPSAIHSAGRREGNLPVDRSRYKVRGWFRSR